ncbi:Proline iminopeptidase [Legionella taurinensis]|uniref:Alpha/beta fold hydrolase n=2 Tax=Legionella taurinensis TaxID=70611 RepID=A0A3A5L3V2_9GAMM|nr:alpha/beta fold hydrolase [Legionella taurinensis]RJT66898.1 alpha/beta fold hydrolase [Legionella taurinensis]STY25374.1 Proline iminopeptidase [Legionella taurinensis]
MEYKTPVEVYFIGNINQNLNEALFFTGFFMENSPCFFSRDGKKQLAYAEFGDPHGYPIIFAHGAPGCHVEGALFDTEAKNYGFRFIVLDRPGMGSSDFNPAQTLLAYPLDVKALADHLGLKRFGVMGWSGGGAPTMACGYAIADLIDFCIVLAGYTPLDTPELLALLPKADQFGYRLLNKPWLFNSMFWLMQWMVQWTPGRYYALIKKAVNESDLALLMDPVTQQRFMLDQIHCFKKGYQGTAMDARLTYQPWNYDIRAMMTRIDIFHGTDDKLVPFAFAERNASLIPNCHLHPLPKQGHLFPFSHQQLIFDQAKACEQLSKARST